MIKNSNNESSERRVRSYKLKRTKLVIIGIVSGIILSNLIGYASTTTTTPSNDVYYDNSNSTLESNTVQGALDELYEKYVPSYNMRKLEFYS